MITIYTWDEAPDYYKALSDHGGDEDLVIVGHGNGKLDEIIKIRHAFDTVVEHLDVYELGDGTVHEFDAGVETHLVYIIAHS